MTETEPTVTVSRKALHDLLKDVITAAQASQTDTNEKVIGNHAAFFLQEALAKARKMRSEVFDSLTSGGE